MSRLTITVHRRLENAELQTRSGMMMMMTTIRWLSHLSKATAVSGYNPTNSLTMSMPRDVQEFIDEYPGMDDDSDASENLAFYSNTLRCRPDNHFIDEIHEQWYGDYRKLEYKHGFIQWLFPIREFGMNWESQPLQPHEIKAMKTNTEIITRFVRSYELMLDFYGMRLLSRETGLLGRVLPPRDFKARYRNLVASSHNYLRISRILKCLSELGLECLSAGFLLHVLNEQSEFNELVASGLRNSMDRWWANCLRNQEDRVWIGAAIGRVREGESVFTRGEYEKALLSRKQIGSFERA